MYLIADAKISFLVKGDNAFFIRYKKPWIILSVSTHTRYMNICMPDYNADFIFKFKFMKA